MKKIVKSKKAAKKTAKKKTPEKKSSLTKMIADYRRRLEKNRHSALKEGEKLFKSAVKQIFKNNKALQSFQWNQYTPHWNDGDSCEFGTYFDSLKVNGEEEPEDFHSLEHLKDLLSNKEKSEARIVMELSDTKKDKWEAESLKRDLESLKTRCPKEVSEMYEMKKAIMDLLPEIDDSVYEHMFGEGTVTVNREEITVENCEHD